MPPVWHTGAVRYIPCLLFSVCLGSLTPVLAAEPSQAAGTTPQSAPAATESSSSVAPTAATPAAPKVDADAEAKAQALAVEKKMRGRGYKPVVRNGTTYFCRSETAIGSRFPTQICGTPEDLDRAALNGKETTEKIQQDVTEQQSH